LISWFPKNFFLLIFWTKHDFLSKNNRFLRKKKFRRSAVCCDFMAVQMKNFVRPLFGRCFQFKDFSFWITEGIGLTRVSFHFWPQKQIPLGLFILIGSSIADQQHIFYVWVKMIFSKMNRFKLADKSISTNVFQGRRLLETCDFF
jgi:hypothetical protein